MKLPDLSSEGVSGTIRPRLLTFVDYYLPGYKAGGPIRTIANMVEQLSDKFDFLIVTSDRDMHDHDAYPGITVNAWSWLGTASVFYASREFYTINSLASLLRETPHDLLYLNSFFSYRSTILPLIVYRFMSRSAKPVVIAPRGEFSPGALALKALKKSLYLRATRLAGFYRGLTWQASSSDEQKSICAIMGKAAETTVIAPNMVGRRVDTGAEDLVHAEKRKPGPLRLVFLSRISRMKNLDYLLQVLQQISGPVDLDIYGPVEDTEYWKECQKLINELPSEIHVAYHGSVIPSEVSGVFQTHDLFVFPTRGENFGHVINEALLAGAAVLISDQTPWKADSELACQTIALNRMEEFVAAVQSWVHYTDQEFIRRRRAAIGYSRKFSSNNEALTANSTLFFTALRS